MSNKSLMPQISWYEVKVELLTLQLRRITNKLPSRNVAQHMLRPGYRTRTWYSSDALVSPLPAACVSWELSLCFRSH